MINVDITCKLLLQTPNRIKKRGLQKVEKAAVHEAFNGTGKARNNNNLLEWQRKMAEIAGFRPEDFAGEPVEYGQINPWRGWAVNDIKSPRQAICMFHGTKESDESGICIIIRKSRFPLKYAKRDHPMFGLYDPEVETYIHIKAEPGEEPRICAVAANKKMGISTEKKEKFSNNPYEACRRINICLKQIRVDSIDADPQP